MIRTETARVTAVKERAGGLSDIDIRIEGRACRALNFSEFTGTPAVGDRVVVNTTAEELALGSGGRHFVIWNLTANRTGAIQGDSGNASARGHLMKLRYTPLQRAALSVEEPDSPHHELLREARSLGGQPVIACGLHSQLLPAVAAIKAVAPEASVAYIMTDGGALPAALSDAARWLREHDYFSAIISAGQAFGGDYEAVNIYSALVASRYVVEADIAVVAMGPGIAGTGTALGHTGMEQGQAINAVHSLGGRPVAPLRLGAADSRERHRGVSHHSISALTLGALASALVPVPELPSDMAALAESIDEELNAAGVAERHELRKIDSAATLAALEKIAGAGGPAASTMGRSPREEPIFFLAAGAAGIAAAMLLRA